MPSTIQLAEAAHRRGDLAEAKILYTKVLQGNKHGSDALSADALYGLGTLALQENNLPDALQLLGQASAIQPQAADISFNYALCLNDAGDKEKAIQVTLQAARNCGTDEILSQAICRLLLEVNQPEAVLRQLARFPQKQIESVILRAQACGALGDWDKAVSLLRQLFREHDENPKIARELSLAAGKLRDYVLAIECFARYILLKTATADDYLKFADLHLIARDVGQSQQQLDMAASLGANGVEFHVLKARLARLDADYEVARNASETALRIQPGQGQAWSIRIETADVPELPDLIKRINSSVDFENIKPYHNSLIRYALADAHARLEASEEAFSNYAIANQLQKKNLQERDTYYNFQSSSAQTSSTIKHFPKIYAQAGVIQGQPTPIFILGMPRSGTTLVERMLSQLDNVTAGGENETLGFLAARYQRDTDANKLPLPSSMTRQQWDVIARSYYERTNHTLKTNDSKTKLSIESLPAFLTDKMPHNFNHVGMILSMFPLARVIQMRRDPRDVCLSIYTRSFPEGHNYACSFDTLAHAYKLSTELMDQWLQIAPDRVIDIHYESLVQDPLTEGKKITAFCGLEWRDKCLDFYKDISTSFTFSEIQVRQAIHDNRIGRWKRVEDHLQPLTDALTQQGCLTTD